MPPFAPRGVPGLAPTRTPGMMTPEQGFGPPPAPAQNFPPPAFKPTGRGFGPSGPAMGTPEGGFFGFTPSPFFGGSPGFQTPGPARPTFRPTAPLAGTPMTPEGGFWGLPPLGSEPSPGFHAPGQTRPGLRPGVPPVIAYMLGLLR